MRLDPRRFDRADVALSLGMFLVAFALFCMVIENEGRKLAVPPPPMATGQTIPLDLGMN